MKLLVLAALVVARLGMAGSANATIPHSFSRLAAGGGFVGEAGVAEVTFSPYSLGPHLSTGVDLGPREGYVYGEAAFSYFVTLGLGVGHRFRAPADEKDRALWHVMAGLPMPLFGFRHSVGRRRFEAFGIGIHDDPAMAPILIYIEPFFRWRKPLAADRDVDTAFGLMLKATFGPGK
jgi:hypothetical protein